MVRLTDQQEETSQELDLAILKSVLTGQHLSSSEQLDFALMWNRVDIVTSDIFIYPQEWPPGISFMHDISLLAPNMFLSKGCVCFCGRGSRRGHDASPQA